MQFGKYWVFYQVGLLKKRKVMEWLLCLVFFAQAQPDDWIQQSIDLTINTQFMQAESLIQQRIRTGQDGIEENFYYACVLNSKMTHFENLDDQNKLLTALQKVMDKTDRHLNNSNGNGRYDLATLYFYRGSAYGYRAFYYGQTAQWYLALQDGLKSIDDLKKAIQLDSTLFDAYLGLGVYKYWQSTKLKYVLWLPFVPDLREEGIADIKKAVENGAYSRFSGMHQLIYILLDYGRFDAALVYANQAIEAYPSSQFMRWAHAQTYFKMKNYPEAIRSYLELLRLIEEDAQANPSHYLFCQVRLAEIYDRNGNRTACMERLKLALNRVYEKNLSEKGRDKLQQAGELYKKCADERQ